MRTPIKELPFKVDLTVPLDVRGLDILSFGVMQKCFGKEWDISTTDCSQCAAKDICGIVFKDLVDQKAKELEKEIGSKFLDTQDLDNVTDEKLLDFIEDGKTTTKDLIAYTKKLANLDDTKTITLYLKRWITGKKLVHTKKGIVWIR